jgi:hypothetical protein
MQVLRRLWLGLLSYKFVYFYTLVLLVGSLVTYTSSATVVIRFEPRSLLISNSEPGATATYTITLGYTTQTTVGSLDLKFCESPIPYFGCDPNVPGDVPAGLDVSHAVLSDQTGVNDYSISYQDTNHIILTRNPDVVGNTLSTYTFTGIVNPIDTAHSYAIRMADYASQDATGEIIDLGSVTNQAQGGIMLGTQVPPTLVFCVEKIVSNTCNFNSGGNYQDLGDINDDDLKTFMTTSQMGAGTNASGGYAITVHGTTLASGNRVINPLTTPTVSAPGNSQFGINLVKNTDPAIGNDPDNATGNISVMPDYAIPNRFVYRDGDVVAEASSVSLVGRYTVTYVVNTPPKLRAGVYTTTITYICTGRF